MTSHFQYLDVVNFWDNDEYALREYVGTNATPRTVADVEKMLGFKLPSSYLALIQTQNGGMPRNTRHRMNERTSWSADHIAITGIFGIDRMKRYSLCGEFGSRFWNREWGYPEIGVYVCDCPSAGHDMICLDYRKCGPAGEPEVVHVDQGLGYRITFVARDFATFIHGLEPDGNFGEA